MTKTFIQTREFSLNWDNLGFVDEDLRQLELEIMNNPDKFPVIPGTGGLRKARLAANGKGKRGGARVCFIDFTFCETVYLITVYEKTDKDDLSLKERKIIKNMIESLRVALGGK